MRDARGERSVIRVHCTATDASTNSFNKFQVLKSLRRQRRPGLEGRISSKTPRFQVRRVQVENVGPRESALDLRALHGATSPDRGDGSLSLLFVFTRCEHAASREAARTANVRAFGRAGTRAKPDHPVETVRCRGENAIADDDGRYHLFAI